MSNYEKFKNRGPFRTEIIVVVVLAIAVFILLMVPRFERDKKITEDTTIYFIESVDIPQIDLKDLEIPKPKPVIPVMSEDISLEFDSTLIKWMIDDPTLQDAPPPPEDPDGITPPDSFIVYDEPPKAIGGVAAIANNIVYPEFAREVGAEGTVIVQSFISKKGEVLESVILKGKPGTGLDEAAVKAIEKTKWKPAVQRDRNVGVWIAIPVTFKLNK